MPPKIGAFLQCRQVQSCNQRDAGKACKNARMDEDQEIARRFVKSLLDATGWTPYRLAKEAGVVSSTITRPLNNPNVTHTISLRTLRKLRDAASKVLQPGRIDELWRQAQTPTVPAHIARAGLRK